MRALSGAAAMTGSVPFKRTGTAAIRVGLFGMALLAPAPLFAQFSGVDLGPNSQNEKFPTPRDPAYIAPLLPESGLDGAGTESEASLVLGLTGGGDLATILAERRRLQAENNRRKNRYGERNDQYLDETGQDQAFLEQGLLRQFSTRSSFPRGFAQSEYSETPARRATIIFFLALPITSGIAGGLYSLFGPGIQVQGPADYPGLLGILGVGSLFAGGVAYYDYRETSAAREHAVGHRARDAYRLRNHPFGRRGVAGDSAAGARETNANPSDRHGTEQPVETDPLTLDLRGAAMAEATRALYPRAARRLNDANARDFSGDSRLPLQFTFHARF